MNLRKNILNKSILCCIIILIIAVCIGYKDSEYSLDELMRECDSPELPYQIEDERIIINEIEPDLIEGDFHYIQLTGVENADIVNRLLYEPISLSVEDCKNLTNFYGYSKYEICKANKSFLSVKYYVEFGDKGRETITVNIDLNKGTEISLSQLGLEKKLYKKISKREYSVVSYFRASQTETLFSLMAEWGVTDEELAKLFKERTKKYYLKDDVIGVIIDTGYLAKEIILEFDYHDL